MNKKGLAYSLIVIILVLFVFALYSIISLTAWTMVNSTVQGLDNSTVSQPVKDKIDNYTDTMLLSDKIFVLFFVALLIGFIITSFSLSTDKTIYIVLYFIFLILITIFAMFFSNGWYYIINNSNFIEAAANLTFTSYVFRYLPIITLFLGLIGGIIFYARKRNNANINSNVDFRIDNGGGSL